jgi:formylglycine-generating enzyme required for sulfatase activity
MINELDPHGTGTGIRDLVLPYQPEGGSGPGDPGNGREVVSHKDESPEPQRELFLHPSEAEMVRIRKALKALDAHPPPGWLDGLLWRGLRWSLRRSLRGAERRWQTSVASRRESPQGARYSFEPEMVLVPGGEFLLGSARGRDQNAHMVEQPQESHHLPDYYLGLTPVTNAQYLAFVQATDRNPPRNWRKGRPPRGKERHPVVNVSWYDAAAYCRWLMGVTGKPYRLPTEAEWEKGARGPDGRIYPWGDRWDPARCNTKESGIEDTTPAGAYPQGASPYGLLDMAGNVWEWTSSLYKDYPYRADDGRENPDSAESRVLRGSSWLNLYDSTRCAYRRSYTPAYGSRIHGFRCCLSLPDSP